MNAMTEIRIAPGAEDLGLPDMLKDLLEQNLEQNPHKINDFRKLDIKVGMSVTDAEVEMTLAFNKGILTIHPGVLPDSGLKITTESGIVMALSNQRIKWGLPYYFDETGREIMAAMTSGRLKVKGLLLHFPSLVRMGRVMSVH